MAAVGSNGGKGRRRIALLMDAIEDDYQAGIVRGAAQAAQHADAQLVCLAGGVVGEAGKDVRSQRNFVFDLLDPGDFDGVVVLGGSLASQIGQQGFDGWVQRFNGLPAVCVGLELPSCHSLVVDGAEGMRQTLRHLIQVHNHRRIAFVRGPVASFDAEERYQAYREVLAEHDISEDARLVLQGTWLRDSGEAAVSELFDERAMKVEAVSAIVSANDYMALGVMDALRERGIAVPGDIAVTGFDDVDAGKCAVPPLTTVQQPTEAMGREAVRRVVALMAGKAEPRLSPLATTIVGRRSCGCAMGEVFMAPAAPARPGRALELAVLERRTLIFAELARSARGSLVGAGPRWEERLLSALLADVRDPEHGTFLATLDQMMAGLQRAGAELGRVQPVVGTLRRSLLDCASGDQTAIERIEDVLDSARELIAEWLVRGETLTRIELVDFLRGISQVSGSLLGKPGGYAARLAFEERLKGLGLTAFSLGLFGEPGKTTPTCQCLAGYGPSGRAQPETHFASSAFAAAGVFEQERAAFLVQPLVYEGEPIGLLTLALGERHGSVYEQMRETFGVALRGFRLAALAG